MALFDAFKDRAVAAAAKVLINRKIANFGEVTELRLDNQRKTAGLELQLKGEALPISLEIGSYELSAEGNQDFVSLWELRSSREWITIVLNEYIVGKKFPVPPSVRAAL
jgi:hypothetical protein